MTMLYPNQCYNEVCYKGTALYRENGQIQKLRPPTCPQGPVHRYSMPKIKRDGILLRWTGPCEYVPS